MIEAIVDRYRGDKPPYSRRLTLLRRTIIYAAARRCAGLQRFLAIARRAPHSVGASSRDNLPEARALPAARGNGPKSRSDRAAVRISFSSD